MPRRNAANLLARESILLAFLELLDGQEYAHISITDITRRAGVSRNAYYRNYGSKDEILYSKMDEVAEEIQDRYQGRGEKGGREMLRCCFEVCAENSDFFKALCRAGQEEMIRGHLSIRLGKEMEQMDSMGREFYEACFYLSGLYGVIVAWAQDGMRVSPEQMTSWTCQLAGLGGG